MATMPVVQVEVRPVARVHWHASVPTEIRALVEPYLSAHLRLLPAWLTELRVGWDSDDTSGAARSRVDEEYRCGWVTILPSFLDGTDHFRHDTIVHEFVHLTVNPLYHLALRIADHLDGQEKLQRHIKEDARRVLEGVVVDLTETVMSLVYPPPEAA